MNIKLVNWCHANACYCDAVGNEEGSAIVQEVGAG